MKQFIVHSYALLVSFITSYLLVCGLILLAGLALHFILWIPISIPPAELLGILARGALVLSAILTLLYSLSNDYREAVLERLSA